MPIGSGNPFESLSGNPKVVRRTSNDWKSIPFQSAKLLDRLNPKNKTFDCEIEKSEMIKRISESQGQSMKQLIEEYQKRVSILTYLREHNIRDYKETSEFIGRYYRNPNEILEKIHYEVE